MPRTMPPLETQLRSRVSSSIGLAEIGEVAKAEASRNSQTWRNLHPVRLEALYEMAYLRIFVSWEAFLEDVFLRYLCGYTSKLGQAVPLPGTAFQPTLSSAQTALLGGQSYVLWHNPAAVVMRSQKFFQVCTVELAVSSHVAQLQQLAAVRHRITHAQTDARRKFDAATMAMAGRRYRGARPGAFLRDRDTSVAPPIRWLEKLGRELTSLAAQIG